MPNHASKQTIAIDIDDVLAANAEGFVAFSNKRWGTHLTPDDYSEHWAQMWRVDLDEVESRRRVLLEERVFTSHRFFDEAKPVLEKLKSRYKLVIVSSRRREIEKDTLPWLKKEFGGLFDAIHFAGIWDNGESILKQINMTKAKVLIELGADYLIDDQPKHCFAAAEAGLTALLFGDYGWNRDLKLMPGVVKVNNWQAVEEYFDGIS
jgi:5'(3')-deoxyribonucleotidase